jgi:flagellar hook protein FlgE
MSLFNTLRTGASGLAVSGISLGVIGDNIANLNTTGFKRGTANFADAFPNQVGSMAGPATIGSGAINGAINTTFAQGSLLGTGSSLDVAITGQGFYQLSHGDEDFYTRDGSFGLDKDGYLVSMGGLRVQGYPADETGLVSSVLGDMLLDTSPTPPRETSEVTMDLILDPEADFATTPYAALTLDGSAGAATVSAASDEADYSTSVTVYDSLGRAHDVVINFERTADDAWTWSAIIDGGETDIGVAGAAFEISSGTLSFDTDGNLSTFTGAPTGTAWEWPGADTFEFNYNLGLDAAGLPIEGSVRQQENDGGSTVTAVRQDGFSVGTVTEIAVDETGTLIARFNNGEEKVLGQLALAMFPAEGGLDRAGGNLYQETIDSGEPALGAAGTGGRGTTTGYALERSNVDLEGEFVGMITAQRSYQANAGVIRTADETLQELVNLV